MSKQSKRRQRAKMIQAATAPAIVPLDGSLVIEAAAGDKKGPRRFSMLAYGGGALEVEGYPLPIVADLEGMEFRGKKLPTYYGHHDGRDGSKLLGHSDTHEKASGQLMVGGAISAATKYVDEVVHAHDNGYEWQASIGAVPYRDSLEKVPRGKTVTANGREFEGPVIIARRSMLRHIAVLPEGADLGTSLSIAAGAANQKKESQMDPEYQKWIEALFGGEVPELTDKQKATLQARYKAELEAAKTKAGDDGAPPITGKAKADPPEFDLRGIELTHAKHVAGIEARAAEYDGKIDGGTLAEIRAKAGKKAAELKSLALNEEWAPARLEVELVKAHAQAEVAMARAELPKGPAIHGSTRDVKPEVIEAALGRPYFEKPEKVFKEDVLEASDKHFRNIGLQEILLLAAGQNGYSGRQRIGVDNVREVLRYAFPIQASGVSTIDVAGILSNTANKILLEGFMNAPQTWREVAEIRSVSDFKQVTAYRMTADLEYEEVGASGEIKHGELGEESYTMQAKTYAKMLALTRTDIINDDLGAFNDIRKRLSLGSVLKMNKVFWTLWINNSTFFTAARGNYISGATTALGEAGLNQAVQAFRDLKGPDGNYLGLSPDRIVVPTALEATAKKWHVSTEIRDTTASTKTPTANIYQGSFRPVPIPELGDSNYTGYSVLAWYLLCNPAFLATAAMCFLNGVQAPTIESADADFNTLGILFRGFHDFGVSMTEYRAGVKSKGEA